MAFSWLDDFKKSRAGNNGLKNKVTVPDKLFGDRYKKAGIPGRIDTMDVKNPMSGNKKFGIDTMENRNIFSGAGGFGDFGGELSPSDSRMDMRPRLGDKAVSSNVDMSAGRFTGYGGDNKLQPDKPTAINSYAEHEGEYVIPAATVKKMGGPKNVNSVVDQLQAKADERSQSEMKAAEGKWGLAGYQEGDVVQSSDALKEAGKDFEAPKLDMDKLNVDPSAQQTKYEGQLAGATDRLEDRSKGISPELEDLAQVSRDKLGGQQSAETGALQQQIAQTGGGQAPGGSVAAQMAINKAAQQGQMTELEQGIFETKVNDMSQATRDLVSASVQGATYEENKRQHGELMAMKIEDFNETSRKYGIDTAMALNETNYQRTNDEVNRQLAAGNFEEASKTLKDKLGIDVDYSDMVDEEAAASVNASLVDIEGYIQTGMEKDNAIVQAALTNAFEKSHPDVDITTEEGKAAYDAWSEKTYNNMKTKTEPIYGVMSTFSDDAITSMFRGFATGAGIDFDIDKVNYNGNTGADGMRMALTDMLAGRILTVGANNSINPPENFDSPEFLNFMKKLGIVDSDYGAAKEGLDLIQGAIVDTANMPEAKNQTAGSHFYSDAGEPMYKAKDGNVYRASRATLTGASYLSRNEAKYTDGTEWQTIGDGEVVYFDKTLESGDKRFELPAGAYTVKTVDGKRYWVNVETGKETQFGGTAPQAPAAGAPETPATDTPAEEKKDTKKTKPTYEDPARETRYKKWLKMYDRKDSPDNQAKFSMSAQY